MEALEQRRQVLDQIVHLHLHAMQQFDARSAVALKGALDARRALALDQQATAVWLGALWQMAQTGIFLKPLWEIERTKHGLIFR